MYITWRSQDEYTTLCGKDLLIEHLNWGMTALFIGRLQRNCFSIRSEMSFSIKQFFEWLLRTAHIYSVNFHSLSADHRFFHFIHFDRLFRISSPGFYKRKESAHILFRSYFLRFFDFPQKFIPLFSSSLHSSLCSSSHPSDRYIPRVASLSFSRECFYKPAFRQFMSRQYSRKALKPTRSCSYTSWFCSVFVFISCGAAVVLHKTEVYYRLTGLIVWHHISRRYIIHGF